MSSCLKGEDAVKAEQPAKKTAQQEKMAGCNKEAKDKIEARLHNGVLTFAFKPDGAITHVLYEIASETCAYFKVNAWGSVSARYTPGAVPGADAIRAAYRAEVAANLVKRALVEISGAAAPTRLGDLVAAE